jgi:hypothetical protein
VNGFGALIAAAGMCLVLGCGEAPLDAVDLPPGVLAGGLVAHWALDDGGGTIAKDVSGHGHDGQLAGGEWISDARFGGGLRLAAGDAVTVSGMATPPPSWTVSLWIRLSDDQLAADSDTWTAILTTENLASGGWTVNLDKRLAQPRFTFSYWSPPLTNYVGVECSCVTTGAWVHLAAVVDADTGLITLYRDGTVADQETWPSDVLPGDSTLYFGRWNMAGRLLSGDLDDIAIWARALTAPEIAALTRQSP